MDLSSMDRYISAQKRRNQNIKKVAWGVSLPLMLIISFLWFRSAIRPHLNTDEIETAVVEYGSVVETISTSGNVELERQFTILAPSTTVLKRIVAHPGQQVSSGDTILILDAKPILRILKEGQFHLEKLYAKQQQNSLKYDNIMLNQKFILNTKTSEISQLQIEVEDQEALYSVGGSTSSKVRQIKNSIFLAKEELVLMKEKHKIQLKELQVTMKDTEADIAIKKMLIGDIKHQLEQMIVRSPVPGVVTEVNGETGGMLIKDKMLVKISDLRTYKITGKITDNFSEKIHIGGQVIIVLDKENKMDGIIGNIRPIVNEGHVYFDVFPEDKSHLRFRPNLDVEIRVIVAERKHTLRIQDGPFFDGAKKLRVYKTKQGRAYASEITTGLVNMDYIEIMEGLQEGDTIVISDVSAIQSLNEVEIK